MNRIISDSESDDEITSSETQIKPSLSKGFTIPKGPSTKPPPTNSTYHINKQMVSTTPKPSYSPAKTEESRKRSISKSDSFMPSLWSSAYDKELPKEVLSKCRDNKCEICNAKFDTPAVARSHYHAKPHEKTVQRFMDKMFKDSGEAPPKRIRTWETGPTYNKGSAEVDNVVSAGSTTASSGYHKSFQRKWLNLWDGEFPKELIDLCVAHRCGLCEVDMSSVNTATSHYEGKPHAKRVKEYCAKIGASIPTRKDESKEMNETFCELCKVTFTSPSMAKGHYNGKEHMRREETGREKIVVIEDKTGRFGIGGNFRTDSGYKPEGVDDVVVEALKSASKEDLTWGEMNPKNGNKVQKKKESSNSLNCEVCNIQVTSQEMLSNHLQGKNHMKKLAQGAAGESEREKDRSEREMAREKDRLRRERERMGKSPVSEERRNTSPQSPMADEMNPKNGNKVQKKNPSFNPSINLNCDICNIQVTSQEMLNSHLQGKNHKKKLAQDAAGGSNGNAGQNFRCDVCNIATSDQNGLDMHLQGAKHKKMLNKMQ